MRGGWDGAFPPSPPRLPPPAHGIKATRLGETWWAQRWIEALERLGRDYAARLRRGRTYARQGRVHDLAVARGVVRAQATGSRPQPYTVTIALAPLSDATWERATRAMAEKALFAARLLAGTMPPEIDEAFRPSGASLFPGRTGDLVTACSCPDWANPCKHVAAVHYVLAEFLDRDPFLLFELRGRSRAVVLAALRRLRAAGAGAAPGRPRGRRARPGGVTLRRMSPQAYASLQAPVDDLRFRIEGAAVPGALLRQLGAPASWRLAATPDALLQPLVARAAALARELALGGPAEPAP
jgi:uncharacterized Zn finger protein